MLRILEEWFKCFKIKNIKTIYKTNNEYLCVRYFKYSLNVLKL